jgi:7-cyano-7-deazaguanine synthase
VTPVYVRTGLVWEAAELHWLRRFVEEASLLRAARLRAFDLPVGDLYGEHWSLTAEGTPGFDSALDSNYLPGRNLLLLAKIAVFAAIEGIDTVALALLVDNPFPDGTPEFFQDFAAAASRGLAKPFRVELPFRGLAKAEVVRRSRGLPVHLTFSCIRPVGLAHCGACTKCAERQHGFAAAGVRDPTSYVRRREGGDQGEPA